MTTFFIVAACVLAMCGVLTLFRIMTEPPPRASDREPLRHPARFAPLREGVRKGGQNQTPASPRPASPPPASGGWAQSYRAAGTSEVTHHHHYHNAEPGVQMGLTLAVLDDSRRHAGVSARGSDPGPSCEPASPTGNDTCAAPDPCDSSPCSTPD